MTSDNVLSPFIGNMLEYCVIILADSLEGWSAAYEKAITSVIGRLGAPRGAFSQAMFAKLKSVITLETSRDSSCCLPYSNAA